MLQDSFALIGSLTQVMKFDQLKRALGMPLASSVEDYVVCKSCLIPAAKGREGEI